MRIYHDEPFIDRKSTFQVFNTAGGDDQLDLTLPAYFLR